MAKSKTDALSVSLEPTPKAAQGLSLLTQAQGVTVADKSSHEAALRLRKDVNAVKKVIADYYAALKKPVNQARQVLLDYEKQHLAPLEQALSVLDGRITAYVVEQQRREREEADRLRREAEAQERARREQEAASAEAEALRLEEASDALSAREQRFVAEWVRGPQGPNDAARIAKMCGYVDPVAAAAKLMKSAKVHTAIAAAIKAQAIRREAEAQKAAPVIVDAPQVESQIGAVSGVSQRSYYACGDVDLRALVLAVAEDLKSGDSTKLMLLLPNMTLLNAEARTLKEMFPRVHPYATLDKRTGIAG